MGRKPVTNGLKRSPWTTDEDLLLIKYVEAHGEGRWSSLPSKAGLLRCGKSCRLRWMNYLRPTVKRGNISKDEEDLILRLHNLLGNRWSLIAARIPGRTDTEVKNFCNTYLRKKGAVMKGLKHANNSMNIDKSIIRPVAYRLPFNCFTNLLHREHHEINEICLVRNEIMDEKPNALPDIAKDLECTASANSSNDVEQQYAFSLQAQYSTVMKNSRNNSMNGSCVTTIDDFIDHICNDLHKAALPSLYQMHSCGTLITDTAAIIAEQRELGESTNNNYYNFCAAPDNRVIMNYLEPSVFAYDNHPATELATFGGASPSPSSWVQFEMHSAGGIRSPFIHSGVYLEDGSEELNMVNSDMLSEPLNTDTDDDNRSMSLFSYLNS